VTFDPAYMLYRMISPIPFSVFIILMFAVREGVDAGGLVSYGINMSDFVGRSAAYVDKILKGAKSVDLPIEQPTKFELIINMKTAKSLGLRVSRSLLARADEVIQ